MINRRNGNTQNLQSIFKYTKITCNCFPADVASNRTVASTNKSDVT